MYKCSECGTEYEIKPEYCDCGNDTFEEVSTPKIQEQEVKPEQKIVIKPTPKKTELHTSTQRLEQPKSKSVEKPAYDYSGIKKFFDPVSTVIFLCLIGLSMYVTWIGYDPEFYAKKAESAKIQKVEKIENIPEIDSYWNNTPVAAPAVVPKVEPVKNEQKIVQLVEQVFKPQPKQQTTVKPAVQAKPQVTQKPAAASKAVNKNTANQIQKPAQTTKQTTQTKKTATQNQKTSTSSAPKTTAPKTSNQTTSAKSNSGIDLNSIINNNKKYTNNMQQTTSSQTSNKKPAISSSTTNKTSSASSNTTVPAIRPSGGNSSAAHQTTQSNGAATPVKTVDTAALKQELANYKVGLRNTIGKKIDFARVVGDGDCSLSFKLDSSGRLINRAFTKQSSNVTLNDAVYAALNSTTRYNPPPAGYKNETLNLNIRFYNGNFSISLN